MFWSSSQEQTAALSQAEAEQAQAARASLVERLTTDPVVVSARISGIFQGTHISQLQNQGWAPTGSFVDLPNRGLGHSDVELGPASAGPFYPGFDYSDNYVNYNSMNAVG
jgi:hypothetical protein